MDSIKLRSHVGPDGILKLEVPVGIPNSDVDVVVTVERVIDGSAEIPRDALGWPEGFFEETAGAWAGGPLDRDEAWNFAIEGEQMDQVRHKLTSGEKLAERCTVLSEIIRSIAPIYLDSKATENQKQLIETMIGAAIWYMPQGGGFWTGKISIEGVRLFHPERGVQSPKLTADHSFPRKVAAKELLNMNWTEFTEPATELLNRYTERYGRYNLITPTENRRLMKFQKTANFQNAETAYGAAGVELVSISREQLAGIKARNRTIIESFDSGAQPNAA